MTAALASLFLIIAAASRSEAFSTTSSARNQLQRIGAHHQLNSAHDTCSTPSTDNTACAVPVPMPSRRAVVAAASTLLITGISTVVSASEPEEKIYIRGTATLQSGQSLDETIGPNAAMYVTARPNRPNNVPRAILDGSRGKPPPVLSARFANPTFPYEFTLTSQNFTPEGASIVEGATNASNDVWWSGEDLIVSARLDSDGVAATRDPTDLVGRGIYSATAASTVSIELGGRGIFGKSVTTGNEDDNSVPGPA
eukprot:CAMPEP_0201895570 /NCGR_PEP_ID=MMETSP0902-20130614/42930_1 /ASSEMBLY_ACC=CAM_ASM_000551 /TAXON_ID=420261 /ORGANISM="Thalassiosira antarctica, Strain CCMP982" /LENGTH=253 /DNA_ID=CAMNT_0048427929 /DNA_START=48 /DNA_END=807 /DNA_ORIENTATION=+